MQWYTSRRNAINPNIYASLMSSVTDQDVMSALSTSEYSVAPGHDHVSAGVWRICCELSNNLRWAMTCFVNMCIQLRCLPRMAKQSIIVPLLKKVHGEHDMSNIRPI